MIRYLMQERKMKDSYDYFIVECNNLSELYTQLQIKYGSQWQKPHISIIQYETFFYEE